MKIVFHPSIISINPAQHKMRINSYNGMKTDKPVLLGDFLSILFVSPGDFEGVAVTRSAKFSPNTNAEDELDVEEDTCDAELEF